MNIIGVKVLVAILFGLIRFSFGTLPIQVCSWLGIYIKDGKRNVTESRRQFLDHSIIKLQSFGGGILFATCFLHMMPEVYYAVKELEELGVIETNYPISQLVVSIGFFLIYFLEEVSNWLISISPPEPCKRKKLKIDDSKSIAIITVNNQNSEKNSNANGLYTIKSELDDFKDEYQQTDNLKEEDSEEELNLEFDQIIEREEKTTQQIIRCLVIVIALSLHAIFEGLAMGLQHSETNIWYLFVAMSIHSATILFCIGLEIYLAGTKTRTIIIHMLFLAITSPVGILLGLVISLNTTSAPAAKFITIVVLEGISAGTILYITFFEILNREKERRACRMKRAFLIASGFGLMAGLECLKLIN